MLRIEYHVAPAEWDKLAHADAADLDEAGLRYYYLWGTINLVCAGAAGSLSFQAPILDFVLGFQLMAATLRAQSTDRYEFTESTAGLSLARGSSRVRVSADFADWTCEIGWEELVQRVRALAAQVLADVRLRVPELYGNPTVQAIRAAPGQDEGSA